jgi:hypothetical protein
LFTLPCCSPRRFLWLSSGFADTDLVA